MEQWIDIYDSAGINRLGGGPITTAKEMSVKRKLDGGGSISFSFPATDNRALDLCQNERQARLFIRDENGTRELGRGPIRSQTYDGGDSKSIRVQGGDALDPLKRVTVGRFRSYEDTEIATIAADLVSDVEGWTLIAESGLGSQDIRLNGANVLKSLIRSAQEKGLHIRAGLNPNTVEIGAFGSQISLVAANIQGLQREIYGNRELLLIDRPSVETSTESLITRVFPLGGGEGTAAITLERSTRSAPYTIGSVVRGGVTEYYIQDDDAVAAYGVIEGYRTYKQITPISNSDTGYVAASNAVYDAAAADLARNCIEIKTYRLSGKKPAVTIRPGDKIKVEYNGQVYRDNTLIQPAYINDWFWVISVDERLSSSGLSVDLEVSNIDQEMKDISRKIADTLEAIDVQNVAVKTFPTAFVYGRSEIISGSSRDAVFRFSVNSFFTKVGAVLLIIETFPLTAPTYYFNTVPPELTWNVTQGYNYPSDLSVLIDGVDRSAALGGTWNAGGVNAGLLLTLDITQYIVSPDIPLYQTHEIRFKSLTRSGEVRIDSGYPSIINLGASTGEIDARFLVIGDVQAIY